MRLFRDSVPVAVVLDSLVPTENKYGDDTTIDDDLDPKFARSLDSKQGYPAMFEKVFASSAIVPDN